MHTAANGIPWARAWRTTDWLIWYLTVYCGNLCTRQRAVYTEHDLPSAPFMNIIRLLGKSHADFFASLIRWLPFGWSAPALHPSDWLDGGVALMTLQWHFDTFEKPQVLHSVSPPLTVERMTGEASVLKKGNRFRHFLAPLAINKGNLWFLISDQTSRLPIHAIMHIWRN